MSPLNLRILAATALLGIVLYAVLQLIADLPEDPRDAVRFPAPSLPEPYAPEPASPEPAQPAALAPGLPVDASPALPADTSAPPLTAAPDLAADAAGRLRASLAAAGVDADAALAGYREWLAARGFLGPHSFAGVDADSAPRAYYRSLDDATLAALAASNELGALQEQAARAALGDPFRALALYSEAATLGSPYALFEIGAILESVGGIDPADFAGDAGFAKQLDTLRGSRGDASPDEDALAFALAAVREGGAAVTGAETLDWIGRLAATVAPARMDQVCRRSMGIMLEYAGRRRSAGLPPLSTAPPPVFVAVPGLAERLPCNDTLAPVVPIVETAACVTQPLEDAGAPLALWVCPGAL